jgi:hypothetical protein
MAGRYENHIVVAEFDLRIKSGQILAVSTFKQKLSEIESRFNYNYKDKATLVLKELQTILIESVVLDNNPEPYLIIKGAENVRFQLVVDEPVTEDELAKRKLELIARINSIYFLRNLISSGELSYENLDRAIQKTSDPKFLKNVIRTQEMPRMEIRIDSEKYVVESFEIPKEWRGGDPFTISNYKVDKVGRKGDVCLHMLDENIGESRIGDDPFIWVEVETSTITYEALKLASSMGLPVSVDLIKMRKTRKNYPHYKLLALHNLDQILEGVKKEVADFEEKLSFL